MIHNLKMQAAGRYWQNLFRKMPRGLTREALTMLGILAAVSLVSLLVFIETLFP